MALVGLALKWLLLLIVWFRGEGLLFKAFLIPLMVVLSTKLEMLVS